MSFLSVAISVSVGCRTSRIFIFEEIDCKELVYVAMGAGWTNYRIHRAGWPAENSCRADAEVHGWKFFFLKETSVLLLRPFN